jgi:hypothetical protein
VKLPWKYILVSLLIGLLMGGSVGLYYSHDLAHQWIKKGPEMFLRHLDRNLHLDDSQRTQIQAILQTESDKVMAYHDQMRQIARTQIRTHLTPDQQSGFDAMIAKHDAERQKRDAQ